MCHGRAFSSRPRSCDDRLEHEEILPQLALANGDYFKNFRHIQVPGIDIIWHQLWMDNPANFPKLASSAAHLYGFPRSMCEAFAAYLERFVLAGEEVAPRV